MGVDTSGFSDLISVAAGHYQSNDRQLIPFNTDISELKDDVILSDADVDVNNSKQVINVQYLSYV